MKTVLIDFSRYNEKGGFGEIANNYSEYVKSGIFEGLRFVALVKEKYRGALGPDIQYVTIEHLDEDLRRVGHIDLWHTTDQLFIKRRHAAGMVNMLTVHDLNFLREKKHIHKYKALLKLKWHIMRSDCVTVISQYAKNDLLAHASVGHKPLRVIYNGIQGTENDRQVRPAFAGDDKFFFTLGRICKKKNFHSLVPMMKHFPDHRLYICGEFYKNKYRASLTQLIHDEGLADRVFLCGTVTDEERNWLYAHSDAFLFPSLLEGFGIPVLEAMRFRCKVFSSRCTSLPEVCKDHATYFDSFDPDDMAATVKRGLAAWSPDSEEAIAAQEYSRKFTYDKYVKQYITLYKELLHV